MKKKLTVEEIDNPLISVIINCFNGEKFLKETIDSVINQSYKNFEIIFWDNQSSDKSKNIITKYKDERIKYFYAPRHTILGEARFLALKKASGSWIAYLDTDDIWFADKLEKQVRKIGPEIGLVYCRSEIFQKKNNKIIVRTQEKNMILPSGFILKDMIEKNYIYLVSALINKKKLSLIAPNITKYVQAEDYYMFIKIAEKYRINVVQEVCCRYRLHDSNLTIIQKEEGVSESIEILSEYYITNKNLVLKSINRIKLIQDFVNRDSFYSFIRSILLLPKIIGLSSMKSYLMKKQLKISKNNTGLKKIVFLVTSDEKSGVENMLRLLADSIDVNKYSIKYVVMMNLSTQNAGNNYDYSLGVKKSIFAIFNNFYSVVKLYFFLKKFKPDILLSSVYYADFLSSIIGGVAGVKNIVWGIHNGVPYSDMKNKQKVAFKLVAFLSHLIPRYIISCSYNISKSHINNGYDCSKLKTIQNGVDVNKFKPNNKFRESIRRDLNISDSTCVLGSCNRFDLNKGHKDLFVVLASLISKGHDLKLVLCGRLINSENSFLMRQINKYNLNDHVILLGEKQNIHELLNIFDLYVTASYAEAFPLTIIEAMSCGIPVVSYDVGDTQEIIGDTGWVCDDIGNMQNFEVLVNKFLEESVENIIQRKDLTRRRIVKYWSHENVVQSYSSLFDTVVNY